MILLPRLAGFTLDGDEPLPDPTDFLIGNFIPMKGVGLVVGESKIGKTFLIIGMAASVASGSWFLGQYLAASSQRGSIPRRIEGGSTLIVAGEGLDTYPTRLKGAYQGLGDQYKERLAELGCDHSLPVYWCYQQGLRDDRRFDHFFGEVCELIERLKLTAPRLPLRMIFIDTLPAVFGFNDENSAAEAQSAFAKMVELSEAAGAVVIATMHPPKNKRRGSVRGSSVFEGSPDVILTATKCANSTRKLTVSKSRANAAENESWGYRLVQTRLPNGVISAYVDGPERTLVPPPEAPEAVEGGRMTRDAKDVLMAMRNAIRDQAADGPAPEAVGDDAIRVELSRIKVPVSPDPRQRKDAERKTYARGVEWLLRAGEIEQHDYKEGQTSYRIVSDASSGSGAIAEQS